MEITSISKHTYGYVFCLQRSIDVRSINRIDDILEMPSENDETKELIIESTPQLDIDTEAKIIDFIFNNYIDCTIVFATHNKLISGKCNRAIQIDNGKMKVSEE